MTLDPQLRQEIITFLVVFHFFDDKDSRKALLLNAGLDPVLPSIRLSGNAQDFVTLLVDCLDKYGTLPEPDGRDALCALLETVKTQVGQEGQQTCERLITRVKEGRKESPPVTTDFSFKTAAVGDNGVITKQIKYTVQQYIENLGGGTAIEMIAIPGGSFKMGTAKKGTDYNEYPQHLVNIKPFYMSKHPVTQKQWLAVMKKRLNWNFEGDMRPVDNVSWDEAIQFCEKLSKRTRHHYRLPSEAEWEYACHAGTDTSFYFGDTITPCLANYNGRNTLEYSQCFKLTQHKFDTLRKTQAWSEPILDKLSELIDKEFYTEHAFSEAIFKTLEHINDLERIRIRQRLVKKARGIYHSSTLSVDTDTYFPNAFGLYGMHGNVWEWCADQWHDNYKGAPTDGRVWKVFGTSPERVLRGGSWNDSPDQLRSACRQKKPHHTKSSSCGFRLVFSEKPPPPPPPWIFKTISRFFNAILRFFRTKPKPPLESSEFTGGKAPANESDKRSSRRGTIKEHLKNPGGIKPINPPRRLSRILIIVVVCLVSAGLFLFYESISKRPPAPPIKQISLRNKPTRISAEALFKEIGIDSNRRPLHNITNYYKPDRETIIDQTTRLMWEKSGSKDMMDYEQALAYINQYNQQGFLGYADWRLPTIPELMSLVETESSKTALYIDKHFNSTQTRCWSADQLPEDNPSSSQSAWFINFNDKRIDWDDIKNKYYVRAVRSVMEDDE